MRKSTKCFRIGAPLLLVGGLAISRFDSPPIVFQSEESKTEAQTPVFNRIRLIPTDDKDIWMMQQSHRGFNPKTETWDRLAIVIDKTKTPRVARFYQLEPGELDWNTKIVKRREFRVSCFICHSNGPRAIRPQWSSKDASVSILDRARIGLWNLRIKSYGRVVYDPRHDAEDKIARVPFRHHTRLENDPLIVDSCIKCHRDSGWFARGRLTRQNALTIGFMISQRHMPPFWFGVSDDERNKIEQFLGGF